MSAETLDRLFQLGEFETRKQNSLSICLFFVDRLPRPNFGIFLPFADEWKDVTNW
jgi:hypothetical protein